jgi:LacI family transcriptional regulator
LISVFEKHTIKLVFVTNSRVFYVARFLEEQGIDGISLIGFDFIEKNLAYLEKETIDFLICQRPAEQAYQGVMALYNHLVRKEQIEKNHYMSIDIITKENYKLYRN